MANRDAFAALGDPTRRAVFERLRAGPGSVGAIAAGLPVSRPAVSQHLNALRAAGLVRHEVDGTRRLYPVDPLGLGELLSGLDRFWSDRSLPARPRSSSCGRRRPPPSDRRNGNHRDQ